MTRRCVNLLCACYSGRCSISASWLRGGMEDSPIPASWSLGGEIPPWVVHPMVAGGGGLAGGDGQQHAPAASWWMGGWRGVA